MNYYIKKIKDNFVIVKPGKEYFNELFKFKKDAEKKLEILKAMGYAKTKSS